MTTVGHNAKRVGAEVLADMLAGYGVTHVFMVPAVLRRTFAEMERRTKIARIHCHGEKSAAYMADGYARASGKPGVCMAQVIGALNLAAGLRDAYLAHSPVIAMTGGRDPKTKFRKVYQEIDDVPAFEPVTKMNVTIDDVARIPDMVRQAFRTATTGAPGPVHLQFRGNEGQVDLEEAEMDGLVEAQFSRVPPFRPEPEAAHVKAALELLQKAERPIIVAGGGARASGAGKELVALAEALQIPIATSLNGKDIIPGVHPLSVGVVGSYSRESANRAVNVADLVCFIGTETGGMTTHFWAVPKIGTPAIQIDIEPEALGRNYPLQASVLGDAKSVLVRMLGQIDKSTAAKRANWIKDIAALRNDWYAKYKPMLESDAVPIHPARICGELSKHMPDDAIVVVDTGHAGMWMGGMYDLRTPAQSYMRSAGHLGWAFPAGIGAKAACPGPTGRRFHRRCRLLVPHRRGRDGGALEYPLRHRRQQQRRRQPVEARLRPRLWRRADRAGARIVDLQQDEFRQAGRGYGRPRHPRRGCQETSRRRSSARLRQSVRQSSMSSPTSKRWRRRRSPDGFKPRRDHAIVPPRLLPFRRATP